MRDIHQYTAKHLGDLPCPICKTPRHFGLQTLRNHLENFHRRYDFMELVELSKEMCGIREATNGNSSA